MRSLLSGMLLTDAKREPENYLARARVTCRLAEAGQASEPFIIIRQSLPK